MKEALLAVLVIPAQPIHLGGHVEISEKIKSVEQVLQEYHCDLLKAVVDGFWVLAFEVLV